MRPLTILRGFKSTYTTNCVSAIILFQCIYEHFFLVRTQYPYTTLYVYIYTYNLIFLFRIRSYIYQTNLMCGIWLGAICQVRFIL